MQSGYPPATVEKKNRNVRFPSIADAQPSGHPWLMKLFNPLAVIQSWHEMKIFIEQATRIEHGTLHVIVGILAWLLAAFMSRRSICSWLPWTVLLALILWNETVDLLVERWPDRAMQYGDCARDILLTMFAPTVLMIAARLRPQLFRRNG
jgi:hypothetical protein